ncbi:MAG: hypothetical protein R2792_11140 [Saprospiraceae bacterium]
MYKHSTLEYHGNTQGFREAGNWCFGSFSDAVLISAPPQKQQPAFFDLDDGLYKVVVDKEAHCILFYEKNRRSAMNCLGVSISLNACRKRQLHPSAQRV